MADKKTRNIKVCRQPGYNRKPAPEIKLSGQWLREVGFDIGSLIKVQCEDGKLVILLDKVREEELEAQKAFIKDAFVKAVNAVIPEKDELIANTKVMMRTLCDTTELEVEQSRLLTEMDAVAAMVERIVAENKAAAMDQEEYQRRRNELVARYEATRDGYEKASGEISDRQGKRKTYMRFIGGLQKLDGFCGKFDEELWTALLDYATVYARDDIRFTFKAGNEVKVDG